MIAHDEFPYSTHGGDSRRKKAWVSRVRHEGKSYYIVADYFLGEKIEEVQEESIGLILFGTSLAGVFIGAVVIYLFHRRHLRKQAEAMKGVVEITKTLPAETAEHYKCMIRSEPFVDWYWSESDGEERFVKYSESDGKKIEEEYKRWRIQPNSRTFQFVSTNTQESCEAGSLTNDQRIQFNSVPHSELESRGLMREVGQFVDCASGTTRRIFRKETHNKKRRGSLPDLPDELGIDDGPNQENLLPTFVGQIVQVTRTYPKDADPKTAPWLYGKEVIPPSDSEAINQDGLARSSRYVTHEIHNRVTSGWFPRKASKIAGMDKVQEILRQKFLAASFLNPPSHWNNEEDRVLVPVVESDPDYHEVKQDFLDKLKKRKRNTFEVVKIERVQNLSLWQWYSVKLWTMKQHKNNQGEDTERKLYHGTSSDNAKKICNEGFNPIFANAGGKWGVGVYFAKNSAYSSNPSYAKPDKDQVQQMFRCRVATGKYRKGRKGMKQPDQIDDGTGKLYDSAVNRTRNPTIFVVFNENIAYPEYLISFKKIDRDKEPQVMVNHSTDSSNTFECTLSYGSEVDPSEFSGEDSSESSSDDSSESSGDDSPDPSADNSSESAGKELPDASVDNLSKSSEDDSSDDDSTDDDLSDDDSFDDATPRICNV